MRPWIIATGCLSLVLIGAGAYGVVHLQHRCRSDEVTDSLARHMPKDKDDDGILILNAHLMPGQLFSFPYACEAEATPLRTGIDLTSQSMTHVTYEVVTLAGKLDVKLLDPH